VQDLTGRAFCFAINKTGRHKKVEALLLRFVFMLRDECYQIKYLPYSLNHEDLFFY
jgi:hypothetical protein